MTDEKPRSAEVELEARAASSVSAEDGAGGQPRGASSDVVLIHGVTEDGDGLRVLRCRNDAIEAGAVHRLREGRPIHGELVRLKPRPEMPLLCDVEVDLAARDRSSGADSPQCAPARSHGGPPQVATDVYRANWDAIWNRSDKAASN